RLGHQPSLERYSKTCYFSRQVSFVSKNPLPLGMGSMSKENKIQNVVNGLKEGIDINIIAKITKVSIQDIEKIKIEFNL
ncbi:hypothetical protein, partial [Megamonas funiformis]|uniref:hypothetical protein n=1 Tax=Megamonas funiformis TaxID=437897 RepID=UPI00195C75BB